MESSIATLPILLASKSVLPSNLAFLAAHLPRANPTKPCAAKLAPPPAKTVFNLAVQGLSLSGSTDNHSANGNQGMYSSTRLAILA